MKCRYCDSPEELKWPQPYKKGDKPIRELDGKAHTCQNKKPQEISASVVKPQEKKETKADWGEWNHIINGREGYYKCKKCPVHCGILNKNDPDFAELLANHNAILHPFAEDFSWIKDETNNNTNSMV